MRKLKNIIRRSIGLNNDTDFYAQAGEDAIVSNIFSYVLPTRKGYYVDVGAFHPYQHSNTYLLYRAGWRGINIDPRPGSKALFDKHRPKDINVEGGVASEAGSMTYYVLGEDSTMNSFSKENIERLGMLDQIKQTVTVPVYSLDSILAKHPEIRRIDYLNIDAEGFELEILRSLNLSSTRPRVISLEQNGVFTLADIFESEPYRYLDPHGYTPIAKNIILRDVATIFYFRNEP